MSKKPAKLIEEHLNRAKAAFLKGDVLKPMIFLAEALKILATANIHSTEMGRVGTLLRENIANLNKIEQIKAIRPQPFSYVKGKEKALLAALVPLIKKIKEEQDRESLEAMRERKLKIDKALAAGMGYLEKGGLADALASFRLAAESHVDEDALFTIVAQKLHGTKYYKESMEYVRRAVELDPAGRVPCELAAAAFEGIKDPARGEKFFSRFIDKQGENPHLLLGLARMLLAGKKFKEAMAAAIKAVKADPGLVDAKKLAARIKRLAAKAAKS